VNRGSFVVDTQLLVLLVVGTASKLYISRHKRLHAFTEADFALLIEILGKPPRLRATPNTLTETANLVDDIAGPARLHIVRTFGRIVPTMSETYVPGARAVARPEFERLGLTDAALLDGSLADATLLTADVLLYLAAVQAGRPARNFHHDRAAVR
jgi:hypothetical protein